MLRLTTLLVSLSCVSMLTASSGASSIFLDTFDAGSVIDSQSDFETIYRVDPDRNGTIRWSYGASAGRDGSGGLNASGGDGTWNTRRAGFDGFSDSRTAFTLSVDVNVDPDAGAGFDVAAYYFLRTANTSLSQSTSKTPPLGDVLSFGLVDDGGEDVGRYSVFSNGSNIGALTLEPDDDATDDDPSFLRLVGTFTRDENGNFDLVLEVLDLAAPAPVSLGVFTHNDIVQAAVANAPALYAAFGGRARSEAGVFDVDNFSVSVVPEPASLALLSVGVLCLRTRPAP